MEEQKSKILSLLRSQDLGVIATINEDGSPEAAVVGIAEREDLSIVFGTASSTRKYQNISRDGRVALVIGWDDATVQYEGRAEELFGEERDKAAQEHLLKLPGSEKFSKLASQAYFKVTPTWIRYTDFNLDPLHGQSFEIDYRN